MNKKFFVYLIAAVSMFLIIPEKTPASAVIPQKNIDNVIKMEENPETYSETEIIKKVSLKNKFKKSPEAEIASFFKKYNKYSEKYNIEKLKNLYSSSFENSDRFDKGALFKMLSASSSLYNSVKCETEIKDMKISGKYASVKVHEILSAKTADTDSKTKDTGIISSDIDYTAFLVKEGNDWKIQASEITSEEVSIKYGEAKTMQTSISAPECVPAGAEYEASIKAATPDGSFVIGSIINENIVYPSKGAKSPFKAVTNEALARVLTANTQGLNEYVSVSIALTRAETSPDKIHINMTGTAFLMKRVNVIAPAQKIEK